MAQPVPFHDPNAPFRPGQPQQRQRPAPSSFQAPVGGLGMGGGAAPHQFYSQPAAAPRPGQQHQFFQNATPAAPADNGFYNRTPQSFPQEFRQPPAFNQQPQQQFQSAPGFQQRHHQPQQRPQESAEHPPQQTPSGGFGGFAQAPGSHGHHAQPSPDFINQFSSNPMAGLAMNTAQDFLSKQSERYLPGAYGVWGNLKYYFTVNNSYVKSRLKILLLPFCHKNWRRMGHAQQDDSKMEYAPPTRDVNAPDLYIPFMGFLTYILIVGYSKGTSNQFSPDVIGADASYCLVMQLIEIGVLAACLYVLNSSISFLDLLSFSGYKYIPLVVDTVVYQLLGSVAYYVVLLYTGVAVSYFTLNCMKGSVAEPTPENRLFRNYTLFGVSCMQLVLVCWISYTTAPRE